jgi:ABC-type nitrate/sulfonate/bicarbonate transport system substrate-binding protein
MLKSPRAWLVITKLAVLFSISIIGHWRTAMAEAPKEVRIGSSDISFSNFTTYYARDRKFFEKEDLDVKIILAKTEAALAALSVGELDYTTFSTSTIDATLRGMPLRLIAVTLQQPVVSLIVREEINQVSDLKGKRIGISSFGGLIHVAAIYLLKQHGLSPKDVTLLATGGGVTGLAAIKTKRTDAVLLSAPHDLMATKEGFKALLDVGTVYKLPFGGISTTTAKIQQNPIEAQKVLRAVLKATRAVMDPQNQVDVVNYTANFFKLDREAASDFYRRLVSASSPTGIVGMDRIQLAIDSAVERGLIDKPQDPKTVVDFSIVKELKF